MPFDAFGTYGNEEQPAPAFALPGGAGQTIRLWDYKQRKSLVIYFLNPDGALEKVLTTLEADYPVYQAEGAQLLVILATDSQAVQKLSLSLSLNYPLLADSNSLVHTRYIKLVYPQYDPAQPGPKPVALFVADRFGSIYRYATSTEPAKLPAREEVLEIIGFLNNLCNP